MDSRPEVSYSATQAKNGFGPVLEQAIRGRAIIITKHGSPKAVIISFEEFARLKRAPEAKLNALSREFDELFARMQTPRARAAVDRLFRATPQELGRAAVAAARKRE
ncbi:MAG: type II toxin-antitoxin system Phd/YefM family antitoxin [Acidobacteria bacterium]|nr:type II toxin-antitoxin system Phd/YefM family antitoxin [Acidobacteriota bacterium]